MYEERPLAGFEAHKYIVGFAAAEDLSPLN